MTMTSSGADYDSPYLRLVGGHLPIYQPSQLRATSTLSAAANACIPVDAAFQNVVAYEDDIIMAAKAAPQLASLAGTGDNRAVEVATMLASKQACRQGLATHTGLVPAIMCCLPSQQAVQAVASMSRDPALGAAFFESGAAVQMVSFFGMPHLLKDAVMALRNILANQPADALRNTPLPMETVPRLCQFVNINAYQLDVVAFSADCLRLIGNIRTGNDGFRSMLAIGGQDGSLAQRMIAILLQAPNQRASTGLQRKACVAIARLIAAMSSDEQCRRVLVELGAIQGLMMALAYVRELVTSADFQTGATTAVLLAIRNVTESISMPVLSAAHSLSSMPHGIDQVVVGLVNILVTCLGKIPPTAIAYTAGALANLVANSAELKEVAVIRGAVDWLVQAATLSAEVLEPALIALAHLTARHQAAAAAQSALLNAGAVTRLFRLLTPAASAAAAGLARNLMLSSQGRLAMVEQVGVLVTLLSGPACTDAAAALWLMCRDPATNSCGLIVRHGAIPAASRMLFDDQNPEAQCAAAALLWQVAQVEPNAAIQLDQEGVAAPLTQLLHSPDQSAATYAAALLRRLAENRPPAFRQRMNTELAQSLHQSAANVALMSQSATFPSQNGGGPNVHSPTGSDPGNLMVGNPNGNQQWLDTDL